MKHWVYCIVRTDMPLPHQMVQAGHAALEAGIAFPKHGEPSSLIVLQVHNVEELSEAEKYLQEKGIKTIKFFEPSWSYGYTAIGTEPLTQDRRGILRRFRLWGR